MVSGKLNEIPVQKSFKLMRRQWHPASGIGHPASLIHESENSSHMCLNFRRLIQVLRLKSGRFAGFIKQAF